MHICVPCRGRSSQSSEEGVGSNGVIVTGNHGSCEPNQNSAETTSILIAEQSLQPDSLISWYCFVTIIVFLENTKKFLVSMTPHIFFFWLWSPCLGFFQRMNGISHVSLKISLKSLHSPKIAYESHMIKFFALLSLLPHIIS